MRVSVGGAGMLDLHVIRTPTQLSELTVLDEPEL